MGDLTMEAIAGRLGVSERTLGKRLTKLRAKLGVTSLYGLGRTWQELRDGADDRAEAAASDR
ncbi:hypothetical protein [Streptacidiphilus cavernicola]|uniref:HTH luxR-type domain-containing protein n=1 Tax=Streptacidiphilus cavernicola TaxID=3342716 RepID=A0ABV6W071_9ACTN